MKRLRRLAWVGAALCLVALAFGLTVRLIGPEPPGVTEANLRRIRPGMTLKEVEAILGEDWWPISGSGNLEYQTFRGLWPGRDGLAYVSLCGAVGSPTVVYSTTFERTKTSGPLARLRAWLGW
jgi:hypothetical protein